VITTRHLRRRLLSTGACSIESGFRPSLRLKQGTGFGFPSLCNQVAQTRGLGMLFPLKQPRQSTRVALVATTPKQRPTEICTANACAQVTVHHPHDRRTKSKISMPTVFCGFCDRRRGREGDRLPGELSAVTRLSHVLSKKKGLRWLRFVISVPGRRGPLHVRDHSRHLYYITIYIPYYDIRLKGG
jgi:hypothetical protein